MEANDFSPVKSDVHIFIEKEKSMFDSTISEVFQDLKISQLLNRANIKKRCGISTTKVVCDLFHVPFFNAEEMEDTALINAMKKGRTDDYAATEKYLNKL